MTRNKFVLIGLLAVAVGAPLLGTAGTWQPVKNWINQNPPAATDPAIDAPSTSEDRFEIANPAAIVNATMTDGDSAAPTSQTRQAPAIANHLTGGRIEDFGEVLKFNVTPEWILNRWLRVSTSLSEAELAGFRVILVTGTELNDLTGTLTYYFDAHRRVQRIAFRGHTGDAARLVNFLKENYAMQHYPALGVGLFLSSWNAQPISVLQLKHAPVINETNRHMCYEVNLELNRPGETYGLSPQFQALLTAGRQTNQW